MKRLRIPASTGAALIVMLAFPLLRMRRQAPRRVRWRPPAPRAPACTSPTSKPCSSQGEVNDFAKENLGSFTTAVLKNGIPVVIKRSITNRILTLKAVFTGHVSWTPVEKAGLEAVMLTMLTRGSAHYTYRTSSE